MIQDRPIKKEKKRKLRPFEISRLKTQLENPSTLWNFGRIAILMEVYWNVFDKKRLNRKIDTSSLEIKINQLQKYYGIKKQTNEI